MEHYLYIARNCNYVLHVATLMHGVTWNLVLYAIPDEPAREILKVKRQLERDFGWKLGGKNYSSVLL